MIDCKLDLRVNMEIIPSSGFMIMSIPTSTGHLRITVVKHVLYTNKRTTLSQKSLFLAQIFHG
jgi:hypothetical protein